MGYVSCAAGDLTEDACKQVPPCLYRRRWERLVSRVEALGQVESEFGGWGWLGHGSVDPRGTPLDAAPVAVAGMYLVLKQLWANKGDETRRDYYKEEFENLWESILGSMKYDEDQSGEEPDKIGGLQKVRWIY